MDSSTHPPLRLSASIVVYNSAPQLLQRTLQSLFRAGRMALEGPDDRLTIDVVDNASDAAYASTLQAMLAQLPVNFLK